MCPSGCSAFIPNSALSYPFLRCLVTKMKCRWVPVYGKMTTTEIEFCITALYPTATTEPVPRTPRALWTVLLHCFQHKRELIAQTIITGKTKYLAKLGNCSKRSNLSYMNTLNNYDSLASNFCVNRALYFWVGSSICRRVRCKIQCKSQSVGQSVGQSVSESSAVLEKSWYAMAMALETW